MTLSGTRKFLNALKSAGITKYQFDTDLGTHLYNNNSGVIVIDEAEETAYNFRQKTNYGDIPYTGDIQVFGAHLSDIHEVRTCGTGEQIKDFIKAYGLPVDKEQLKIILQFESANSKVKPVTGNYLVFNELTEEQIAKLSEEEKLAYIEAKRINDLKMEGKYLEKGTAIQMN